MVPGGHEFLSGKVHLVCNAHLDPVWLWEWPEGAAEALSTFRSAARLCREFPDFVFNHNEAVLYRWVEAFEPGLFREIKRLVQKKRWHVMGGWPLQPDINLPSGESLVRHVLSGRRYFREALGAEPTTAVNLDSFGHSRGLVQILARSGYDSYLFCRPGAAELPLPGEDFVWVGYDGSEVLAHRAAAHYNSRGGAARKKLESWLASGSASGTSLLLWGVGDHGGGASRRDLEDLQAFRKEHPDVQVLHSTPERYFQEAAGLRSRLPRVERGLNPWAVGCYTSMARVKQKHRQLENELFSAEKMAAAAYFQGLMPYPEEELRQAGADLAFGEFHDILPGSSIPEGEEGALRLLDHGLEVLSRVKAKAFFALASGEEPAAEGEIPILVYNPHPFPVSGLVEAEFQPAEPNEGGGFLSPQIRSRGSEVPCQPETERSTLSIEWRKRVVFPAELEPGRMSRFDCRLERVPEEPGRSAQPGWNGRLQTPWGSLTINPRTGLLDEYLVAGSSFLGPSSFEPLVRFDDADSGGMAVRDFRREAGRFRLMSGEEAAAFCGSSIGETEPVRIVEDGPVRTVVEALLTFGRSAICQRLKVSKLGPELEVETRVAWNEKDRMLKLRLATPWPEAACLGQQVFGVEPLASNGEENVSQKWLAVVDGDTGSALTVVNDRTYGSDFSAGELRLSLLRSPAYAADVPAGKSLRVRDKFVPRQDQGEAVFRFWLRGGPAGERLTAVDREALARNERPYVLSCFPPGSGRKARAFAVLEGEAVEASAIKKAEDGQDLIIRLFEPTGERRRAALTLPWAGARADFELGPFEVKTVRFDRRRARFSEVDLLERASEGRRSGKKGSV